MNYTIRKATPTDIPAMMGLVNELALYEKAPEEVINTEAKMFEDGFGAASIFKAFVAENKDSKEIAGMALYYTAYSTWKGKIFFLDDIVVKESYRQTGIGKKLITALIQDAKDNDIPQIRWQVLEWNTPAIKFYESIGAFIDKEWYTCKMSKENIDDFLKA
jgi:ribosomal protein S18 acetylase RimI-like enzyme